MLRHPSVLVTLVRLVDRLPWPAEPAKPARGRPKTYADRLIVKALVVMIIRRLYLEAVERAFGADIDYAMLIKLYGSSEDQEKRYSPAECVGTRKEVITGAPRAVPTWMNYAKASEH